MKSRYKEMSTADLKKILEQPDEYEERYLQMAIEVLKERGESVMGSALENKVSSKMMQPETEESIDCVLARIDKNVQTIKNCLLFFAAIVVVCMIISLVTGVKLAGALSELEALF